MQFDVHFQIDLVLSLKYLSLERSFHLYREVRVEVGRVFFDEILRLIPLSQQSQLKDHIDLEDQWPLVQPIE